MKRLTELPGFESKPILVPTNMLCMPYTQQQFGPTIRAAVHDDIGGLTMVSNCPPKPLRCLLGLTPMNAIMM